MLATAWWSGPLLLLGRYAPPFLDYIENASITTLPTDLTRTLLGVSDWVAYFGGPDFGAGLHLVGTPFLLVDAAAVAALGLVGHVPAGQPAPPVPGLGAAGRADAGRLRLLPRPAGLLLRPTACTRSTSPWRRSATCTSSTSSCGSPWSSGSPTPCTSCPSGSAASGRWWRSASTGPAVGLAVIALLTPWLYGVIPASDGVSAGAGLLAADRRLPRRPRRRLRGPGAAGRAVRRVHLGQHPRRHHAGAGEQPLGGAQRRTPGPAGQRGLPRRGHPDGRVRPAAAPPSRPTSRPTASARSWCATTSTACSPVRPTRPYVRSVLARDARAVAGAVVRSRGRRPALRLRRRTRSTPGSSQAGGLSDTVPSDRHLPGRRAPHRRAEQAGRGAGRRPVVGHRPGPVRDPGRRTLPLAADATTPVTGQVLTDDLKRREMNFPAVRWNESATMTADGPVPARRQGADPPARAGRGALEHRGDLDRWRPRRRGQLVPGLRRRHPAAGDRATTRARSSTTTRRRSGARPSTATPSSSGGRPTSASHARSAWSRSPWPATRCR